MGSLGEQPKITHGQRLLPNVIDERAISNYQKPFMSIPAGEKVTDGQRDISYGQIANAINRSARWIVETLGKPEEAFPGVDFPPIATYMYPMDFRHPILTLGAIKSGYKMFYSSPRNHPDIQVALLEKLQCTTLFTPEVESDTTKAVLEKRHMNKYILPDLEYFLDETPVEPYPYNKTFEEARKDPYVTLHSSGSTGTPKILVLKLGSAAAHDAFQLFPSFGENPWFVSTWTGKRVLTNFPWVHAGGAHILSSGVFNDYVPVIPASWPFTGADANHLHLHGNIQAAWYSPSVLIDVARNPEFLKNISKLENVSFSGGILPKDAGDAISKYTTVFGSMASTETGILPGEIPPPEIWEYYKYNERLGHTFCHYAGDMYELVHTRDKKNEPFQGIFYTKGDLDVYEMRDVYIEHPTHKGWWRSTGRIDDVVVMADAKKLNTIPYEAAIEKNKTIETALICGSGRPRPAVLVQPRQWPASEEEERKLIDAAWPDFEKANGAGPVHGRLIRELVVVAKPSKPFVKAGGKDTVMRARSLQQYEDEIEQAYQAAEKAGLLYGDVADKGALV